MFKIRSNLLSNRFYVGSRQDEICIFQVLVASNRDYKKLKKVCENSVAFSFSSNMDQIDISKDDPRTVSNFKIIN